MYLYTHLSENKHANIPGIQSRGWYIPGICQYVVYQAHIPGILLDPCHSAQIIGHALGRATQKARQWCGCQPPKGWQLGLHSTQGWQSMATLGCGLCFKPTASQSTCQSTRANGAHMWQYTQYPFWCLAYTGYTPVFNTPGI